MLQYLVNSNTRISVLASPKANSRLRWSGTCLTSTAPETSWQRQIHAAEQVREPLVRRFWTSGRKHGSNCRATSWMIGWRLPPADRRIPVRCAMWFHQHRRRNLNINCSLRSLIIWQVPCIEPKGTVSGQPEVYSKLWPGARIGWSPTTPEPPASPMRWERIIQWRDRDVGPITPTSFQRHRIPPFRHGTSVLGVRTRGPFTITIAGFIVEALQKSRRRPRGNLACS